MTTNRLSINHLGKEKSSYLLQHKDNPVHWYSWGDEAFSVARSNNKPIFLSSGYSSCYWCHVMEKESFESQEIADLLNRYFISIKLDREEHPDVDAVYMDAVVAIHGHGGWPMSVFLSSDGKPFWGGTYFPKAQFAQIVQRLGEAWQSEQQQISTAADQLTSILRRNPRPEGSVALDTLVKSAMSSLIEKVDWKYGGFGGAPKFPPSMQLRFLLRMFERQSDKEELLNAVNTTLSAMALGGLYDQLGGGFHRYSTDERWHVPHFEKMLYDNALISMTYLEGYQRSGNTFYKTIVYETLDFVMRDFLLPSKGFASSLDAGDVGEEGEFYEWFARDFAEALTEDEATIISQLYGSDPVLMVKNELLQQEPSSKKVREKLLAYRNTHRKAPRLDSKVITSWNGLMIGAFARAGLVLKEERYINAALQAGELFVSIFDDKGNLYRRIIDDEARVDACAEDYAFLIEGVIRLYEATFDEKWLLFAKRLQDKQDDLFWDEGDGGYVESADPLLIARRKDILDNAVPSTNAIAIGNLFCLGRYFRDESLTNKALRIIELCARSVERYPSAFCSFLANAIDLSEDTIEVTSSDEFVEMLRDRQRSNYTPRLIVGRRNSRSEIPLLTEKAMELGIIVCKDRTCFPAVSTAEALSKLL